MKTVRFVFVIFSLVFIAAIALADQVDDLIKQLNDSDPLVQVQAIEQLGKLKDKRAAEPLIALIGPQQNLASKPAVEIKPLPADPAIEKVQKAKQACAGGDKHTGPSGSVNPAFIKQLTAKMRTSRNFMDKEKAAEELGKTKDKRAVDPLLAMLKEEDFSQFHTKVIAALGEIGDPKAVPTLLGYLQTQADDKMDLSNHVQMAKKMSGPNAFDREAAVKALVQIGDPRAAEPLYKAILNDPFLKHDGVKLLAGLGGFESVKYLNKLASSDDVFLKRDAAEALEKLGPNHGLDPLVNLLKDPDTNVRTKAVAALTQSGDSAIELELQEATAGLSEQERKGIRQQQSQNQADQAVEDYASNMPNNVRITAMEALGQLADPKAARPLLAALDDPDPAVCKAAGRALGAYNSKAIVRPIEMNLNSKDNTVIQRALLNLGWIGTDYAVELIGKYINDPFMTRQAIQALGNTGNPKAIPYLQQAMQSVHTEDEAMEAIVQINHPDALTLLVKGLSANSFVTRQKAVEGLAKANNPAVIEPLLELFKKNDHTVQDKVIEVLQKYNDPRINAAFADALTDPFQKNKLLAVLKERNWQPQTVRQKVLYYMACQEWEQCAQLGPEAADLLLAELKEKCSSGVAKALNKMQDARAYPVMLDCVKKWQGSPELLAGAEKTGWKPKTAEERLIVASITQDKAALKKLWDESQGKEVFMQALNSQNMSAVTSMMNISIGIGLEEMVLPMINRLNSMKNDTIAVSTANLFLNSGNPDLRSASETWAKNNGYEVRQFGFAHGPGWGKW